MNGVDQADRRRTRGQLAVVEACGWSCAATVVMLVQPLCWPAQPRWTTALLGGLAWLLGVRTFFGHGGPILTAPSVYGFAFSIFFGVGGVYHAVLASDLIQPWLHVVLLLALATQVAVFFAFWHRRPAATPPVAAVCFANRTSVVTAIVGSAVFAATIGLRIRGVPSPQWQTLATGAALAAAVLTAVALIMHERARVLSMRTVAVIGLFLLFLRYIHIGSGRLHVAALGFTLAAVYALRFRTVAIKAGLVLLTAPVLYWMAKDRLLFIDTLATGNSTGRTGLESGVRPPQAFAELLYAYHSSGLELGYGRTFLTVPAMLVPDSIWAGKPLAFGYELARITAPGRIASGYSDASSVLGEWFFDFGYPGLVLMVPAIGLAVPLLDRLLAAALRAPSDTVRLLGVSTAIVMGAGVPDLVWSGTHTYGVRTLVRLAPLLVPLVLAAAVTAARTGRERGLPGLAHHQAFAGRPQQGHRLHPVAGGAGDTRRGEPTIRPGVRR